MRVQHVEAAHEDLEEHHSGENVHAQGHIAYELRLWVNHLTPLLLLLRRFGDQSSLLSLRLSFNLLPLCLKGRRLRNLPHLNFTRRVWLLQVSVHIADPRLHNERKQEKDEQVGHDCIDK